MALGTPVSIGGLASTEGLLSAYSSRSGSRSPQTELQSGRALWGCVALSSGLCSGAGGAFVAAPVSPAAQASALCWPVAGFAIVVSSLSSAAMGSHRVPITGPVTPAPPVPGWSWRSALPDAFPRSWPRYRARRGDV